MDYRNLLIGLLIVIANVRKAINDMLVVDPYMVNIHDLRKPGPGRLIRLRRAVWGRGVKDAVGQLEVRDVTQGHVSDAMMFMSFVNQLEELRYHLFKTCLS